MDWFFFPLDEALLQIMEAYYWPKATLSSFYLCEKLHVCKKAHSLIDWSGMDYLLIIVMFLLAPVHYSGSIVEQIM